MPRFSFVLFFCFVMAMVVAALCSGCSNVKAPNVPVPVPKSGPVIAGQKEKDRTILAEADSIDAEFPAAKPHTDNQRAAVASAPAVDVERIVAEYEAAISSLNNQNGQLKADNAVLAKKLADALEKGDFYIRVGGYGLAALLVAAGVASFFLAAQVPILGPRIGMGLIAAGASVFGLLQAYDFTKAHPWITFIVAVPLIAVTVYAHTNYIRDVKKS